MYWGENMYTRNYVLASSIALFALFANGQIQSRRATITGGGDRGSGKCTIEVVVDGVAEVVRFEEIPQSSERSADNPGNGDGSSATR